LFDIQEGLEPVAPSQIERCLLASTEASLLVMAEEMASLTCAAAEDGRCPP